GAGYDAVTFQVFGELGYGVEFESVRLESFANLAHVRLYTGSYGEAGGAAALSGRSDNTEVTYTTLGLRAEHALNMGATQATPRGTVGWRHAVGEAWPTWRHCLAAGDACIVAGVPIAQDSAVLEAGVDLTLTPCATFGLPYSGQPSGSVRAHGVRANLAIT